MRFKIYFYIFIGFCFFQQIVAMFPFNLFRPYDINLFPPRWDGLCWQANGWFEQAFKVRGFNAKGQMVNPLQIWNYTQDSFGVLKGFTPDSPYSMLLDELLGVPEDITLNGQFLATGDLKQEAGGIAFFRQLPHNFIFSAHLPFYAMQLKNVLFLDLSTDENVQTVFTNNFFSTLQDIDPSLDLSGWKRVGPGDLTFIAQWLRSFPQGKPILRDVILNIRSALTIPTGLKRNIDEIFSIPFGFDGSVGLVLGTGINVCWFDLFKGGLDVEFTQLFGNTRDFRIKTQEDQTEFFFTTKAKAHMEYGFTQRFNLFLEAWRFLRGFSLRGTYQFWKHGRDKLSLCTNEYSNLVANSAESLQGWTLHQLIFALSYDTQVDDVENSWLKPQISFFLKIPFNGDRSLAAYTAGGIFTLNF